MDGTVTREQFIDNQKKYCGDNGAPFFMPDDGYCYRCRRDIIPHLKGNGSDHLVTGCPLCFYSYCE